MKRALLIVSALTPALTLGAEIPQGSWAAKDQRIEVRADRVILNGESYLFGQEQIAEAYTANVSTGMSLQVKAQCRATTHQAYRAPDGRIALAKMHRSRESISGGAFCKMAKDPKIFDAPHAYTQRVLTLQKNGKLTVDELEVTDDYSRPKVTSAELMDPDVSKKNAGLKQFIAQQAKEKVRSSAKRKTWLMNKASGATEFSGAKRGSAGKDADSDTGEADSAD